MNILLILLISSGLLAIVLTVIRLIGQREWEEAEFAMMGAVWQESIYHKIAWFVMYWLILFFIFVILVGLYKFVILMIK